MSGALRQLPGDLYTKEIAIETRTNSEKRKSPVFSANGQAQEEIKFVKT